MKTTRHWLLLTNEAPRIGCGWRLVDVAVGRKWVYLTAANGKTRKRLSVKRWEELKKRMLKFWERNRRADTPSQWDTFSSEGA